jgi:MFS transporter, DHA1 family, tetracycline resistance protein
LRVPFIGAAVLSLLNWLYGYFILPESLPKKDRRAFEWKRANPVGSLLQFKRYPAVTGLILALVLVYIAAHAVQTTWSYYNMEKFDWNEAWVGYSIAFIGLMIAIVQGGLIRIIIPKLGKQRSVYVGLLLYSIGMILFAFASKGWMMFAFAVPYCLGGIAGPALQGIISGNVPPNEQGELQGGLTSLMSATSIIGPIIMTSLFAYFTRKDSPVVFPGAPFITGAILMLISAALAYRNMKKSMKHEAKKEVELEIPA